jgi:hypothetical protein
VEADVTRNISQTGRGHQCPADGEACDDFGHSIALRGDTAIIGANGTHGDQGSAYVFVSNLATSFEQLANH